MDGLEPSTFRLSGGYSKPAELHAHIRLAGDEGIEPTPGVLETLILPLN